MAGLKKKIALSAALVGVATGTGWTADAAFELAQAMMSWTYEPWNMPGAIGDLLVSFQWSPEARKPFVWLVVGATVLLTSVWTLFHLRHGIIIAKADRVPEDGFRGHHTLIMGLSPRNEKALESTPALEALQLFDIALSERDKKTHIEALETARQAASDEATALEIKKNIDNLSAISRHPWQQNLRMIWRHINPTSDSRHQKLARIYIIRSIVSDPENDTEEKSGSHKGYDEFERILRNKLQESGREDIAIKVAKSIVDYEQLNATAGALFELVEVARHAHKVAIAPGSSGNRRGICVDGTAGQKIFSIAAAVVTMNNDLYFGYVDNNGVPKFYDGRIEVAGRFAE